MVFDIKIKNGLYQNIIEPYRTIFKEVCDDFTIESREEELKNLGFKIEEVEKIVNKSASKRQIVLQYQQKMNSLTHNYTPEEQKTWEIQRTEAENWVKDNNFPTPMIDSILGVDDSKEDLVNSILQKAHYLKVESGKLLKWKKEELRKLENNA